MSKSITVKREIYNYVLNSISLQMKTLDIVKNIREKFSLGLGQAKSMYDLVAWNEYHNYDSGQCISFLTDDVRNKISDYTTIIFEEPASTKPYEDSKMTNQEALSKFVSEVRREKDCNMLSHDSLRRIYLANFPLSYGEMRHEYYGASVEMMLGKYILNWPTDRVKYLIPRKEWNIIKGYFNVLNTNEAIDKKIRIIKEIRDSVMECGLAEAKGLFELAYDSVYSGGKYASTEITMIGGKRATIKYIDVVHE